MIVPTSLGIADIPLRVSVQSSGPIATMRHTTGGIRNFQGLAESEFAGAHDSSINRPLEPVVGDTDMTLPVRFASEGPRSVPFQSLYSPVPSITLLIYTDICGLLV